ncbi:sugar transferase [Qipengyuania atrilutea]|uniref:Sugar transferase n=1 Tax=Qipengyuania atrilutea TaxID=2744473 RepID=A0A850H5K5_9SPHN|nr:sugar transferase [Actirhodobacter atriluteus]
MIGKRFFDFVIALVLIPPSFVICSMLAILIVLIDKSNPIFVQCRVGCNGETFRLYKLRTMRKDALQLPSHLSSTNEITRLGAFLRRTKVDELPQVWNVLRGKMSFVGPRPCLPQQIELLEKRESLGVHTLKPGITGLSQLAGLDMSQPEKLALHDAQYLRKWSLRDDIKILYRTVIKRDHTDVIGRTSR